MYSTLRWLIPLLVVLVFAGAGYYLWQRSRPPELPAPAPEPAAQAPAPPGAAPAIQHPIGEAGAESKEVSMPPLGQSDKPLRDALAGVVPPASLEQSFLLDGLVRRVVATVDALPRQTVPLRVRPVKPIPGNFATVGQAEGLLIAPQNAARYAPLVRLAEGVDTHKLVAIYIRYYPLFQQAYVELGYPHGYFNDRLILTIDDLLAAPDAPDAIPLVQPKVLYAYADPELEALSAGQKTMLRMGKDNEARVKAKLRELRRALTAKSGQPSP